MIKFYLHMPELPGWYEVFAEMLEKMDTSGLIEAADEIHLCLNGVLSSMERPLLPLLESSDKFRIRHVNGDPGKWEWPTVNQIKLDCDASDTEDYIGYAHLKGLSRPDLKDQKAVDWRHYLSYWIIEQWEDNVNALKEGYETSSVNWMDAPWPHYSGNFWWANSNYIRRLNKLHDPATIQWGTISEYLQPPTPLDTGNFRFEHEAWIGGKEAQRYEVHASPGKKDGSYHYRFEYPASKYRKD